MERMNLKKRIATTLFVLLAAVLSYSILAVLFSPVLKTQQKELEAKKLEWAKTRHLLSQKDSLQSEWELKQPNFLAPQNASEALNQWVKGLLAYGEAQKLVFTKLEPRQTKGDKQQLFLTFEGDILKLVRLLYHLIEKDPLAALESFSMKQVDRKGSFVYELTLGKVIG